MTAKAENTENSLAPSVRKTFPVLGMTCAGCATSVESMLKSADGVKDAGVNYANQTAWAEYDTNTTNVAELRKAVQSIGYDIITDTEDPSKIQEEIQQSQYKELIVRTRWAFILTAPIVVIGMFFMDLPYGNWIMMALSAPVVFYFGRNFFINAFRKAQHGQANMDTLVAISTGIAFIFSLFNTIYPQFWHARGIHPHVYYEAAAVVITFISLGKLMEEKAKSNTSSAIKKLMGLQPKTVKVIVNGKEEEVPIAKVKVSDEIIVKPGERIPVDGVVSGGSSFIDESTISGEPIPVEKKKGDKVFAGTVNQKGSIQFIAEKVGGDTVLAHIIKMVQEAQGSKAPVQRLVDKVAGVFVPAVLIISVITFITWMVLGSEDAFTHALLTSITVLVIACPCALGLATPTAIMVGVGKGAENNILIKDAESLELAHKVNAVILDKTGTITEGRPAVTDLIWLDDLKDIEEIEQIFFAIENRSEHPLAMAISNYFKEKNVSLATLDSFESISGKGVQGTAQGILYFIGTQKFLQEHNIELSPVLLNRMEELKLEAKTVIGFSNSKQLLAIVAIADKIKASSKKAIELLRARGVEVHMLTGDNPQTAEAVAGQVGIDHFKAEMLPSDKADYVKTLQKDRKIVAMVGDGINDSHALAQADVSIAMGKGSDIAMDVAKMTLITSDLTSIPKALNLSSKTVKGIRQNLFWAFIYNIIGIPIAAGILYPVNGFLLDPMIAGAAMALSSVSVVLNSLRLKVAEI